jgi:hypothetical protein
MIIMLLLFASADPVLLDAPKERRLHPTSVTASSFLWNDWNQFQENYHPNYIADDDAKTAWVEGATGDGKGESVTLHVADMAGATKVRLRIQNGYQKSPSLLRANGRPHSIRVTVLPSKVEKTILLEDKQGFQEFNIEQPPGPLAAVTLQIVDVYEGTKYTDTCISGVELHVTARTPESPAFEKKNLEAIKDWRKQRMAAAKLFSGKMEDLPIGERYGFASSNRPAHMSDHEWHAGDLGVLDVARAIAKDSTMTTHAGEVARAVQALDGFRFVPVEVTLRDLRDMPTVDGIEAESIPNENFLGPTLPKKLAFLNTDRFSVFQVNNNSTVSSFLTSKTCQQEDGTDGYWAVLSKDAEGKQRTRALLMVHCVLQCGRDGLRPESSVRLLQYADNGQLSSLIDTAVADFFEWGTTGEGGRPIVTAIDHIAPFNHAVDGRLRFAGRVSVH